MEQSLYGKVALITGAGQGIGQGIALSLAKRGAHIVAVGRTLSKCEATVAIIRERFDIEAVAIACDIGDLKNLDATMAKSLDAFGRLDILVNNAVNTRIGPLLSADINDVQAGFQVGPFATLRLMQLAYPYLKAQGGGSIINIGSNSWWEAGGGFPAYATAKSAVHGLTRTMARDLGQHRIRVNTVVPGWIMTERQKALWVTPEGLENQYKRQCLPDLIDPIYVARMVLFLASDDASMCTANNYMVEAGSI